MAKYLIYYKKGSPLYMIYCFSMKVLIFSDLHGNSDVLTTFLNHYTTDIHEIWCIGDLFYSYSDGPEANKSIAKIIETLNSLTIPFYMTKGNCESFVNHSGFKHPIAKTKLILEREQTTYILTHGDRYDSSESQILLGLESKARVVFSGHTHYFNIEETNGVILCNVGSPSFPRNSLKIPSIAILDTRSNQLSLIDLRDYSKLQSIKV